MAATELGTVLTVLRTIRGMNQEELARASGLRSGTISDYERGKMVPGLNTVQRIMSAMNYPFAALDLARTLIGSLQAESAPGSSAVVGLTSGPEALEWEVEQVSVEAGRVVSRLVRVLLTALHTSSSLKTESEDADCGVPRSDTEGVD